MTGTISLSPVTEKDIPEVLAFIATRESSCVTLSEHLLKARKTPSLLDGRTRFFMLRSTDDESLAGVFMLSSPGLLLHCIPFQTAPDQTTDQRQLKHQLYQQLIELILPIVAESTIQCIMGETEGTEFFGDLINASPVQVSDYYLFAFHREQITPKGCHEETAHLLLRYTDSADAESLYPLQEAYELEEVVPKGSTFSSAQCMAGLRHTLKTRTAIAFWQGKNPIAKAAVNAEGLNWVQIGGVYTVPHWRNRGLARRLVQHIAEQSAEQGRGACLFVKQENTAAQNSYRNAGFTQFGEFRIIYY
ncbi:MAG: GNAT family N-acetyltransferase [Spirochaetaceae bacterium]|jgi:predicted GNAT family acetyltransferase|nr:GNAT family N-acetyltransferase [Spirochaetaceae bacterium]